MKTLDQTVQATSGRAPAVDQVDARRAPASPGRRGRATCSAYPPPASSAQTSSPTDQPVDARRRPRRPCREHSSPRIVGRAGRRRVEALPLQRVGPVDRGGGDVDDDLARARARGRAGRRRTGRRATGPGGDDGAHAATLGELSPRTASVGVVDQAVVGSTSSSTSSRSSASRRPSQLSASAGARAASSSTFSGLAPCSAAAYAEQVRRDRARPGAPRCARRRGPGRGSGPRRPRPRCRGRRRARRSSRAGSRVPASYAFGHRATHLAAFPVGQPRSMSAPRTRSTTSSSASPASRASRTNSRPAAAARGRPVRRRLHDRADPAPGGDQTAGLQLAVGTGDGVGGDAQVGRQRAYDGQLLARPAARRCGCGRRVCARTCSYGGVAASMSSVTETVMRGPMRRRGGRVRGEAGPRAARHRNAPARPDPASTRKGRPPSRRPPRRAAAVVEPRAAAAPPKNRSAPAVTRRPRGSGPARPARPRPGAAGGRCRGPRSRRSRAGRWHARRARAAPGRRRPARRSCGPPYAQPGERAGPAASGRRPAARSTRDRCVRGAAVGEHPPATRVSTSRACGHARGSAQPPSSSGPASGRASTAVRVVPRGRGQVSSPHEQRQQPPAPTSGRRVSAGTEVRSGVGRPRPTPRDRDRDHGARTASDRGA